MTKTGREQRLALVLAFLLILFGGLFGWLCPAAPAWARTVRLATLEWPPYVGAALPGQGYAAEVVRKALATQGVDVEYIFLPWARALEETKNGVYDGYMPEYHSPRLLDRFVLSRPFFAGYLYVIARRGTAIAFTTLEDLAPYRIGVVRGYVNTTEFDKANFLNKYPVVDDLTNVRMLVRGRLDLIVGDLNVARFLAKQEFDDADAIQPLPPALEVRELHVCFSKAVPRHRSLCNALNAGLEALAQSGELERIARDHGLSVPRH